MPKRDVAPIGAPCWVDLLTADPERAKAFYGELFGWTAEAAGEEFGGYITFSKDGVRISISGKGDLVSTIGTVRPVTSSTMRASS